MQKKSSNTFQKFHKKPIEEISHYPELSSPPVSESRGGSLSVTYIHTYIHTQEQEQDRIPSF